MDLYYVAQYYVKSCNFNSTLLFKTLVFVNTSSAQTPLQKHASHADTDGLGQKAPDYITLFQKATKE